MDTQKLERKIISFELPVESIEKLQKIAVENERSLSAQLRIIINDFLKANN